MRANSPLRIVETQADPQGKAYSGERYTLLFIEELGVTVIEGQTIAKRPARLPPDVEPGKIYCIEPLKDGSVTLIEDDPLTPSLLGHPRIIIEEDLTASLLD